MSTETAQPVLRVVPGAPPPKELSKSARKKRKAKSKVIFPSSFSPQLTRPQAEPGTPDVLESSSAALIEKAPEPSEIQAGAIAPDLVAQPELETTPAPEEEIVLKLSPIVDLIHKRLKATSKKIVRRVFTRENLFVPLTHSQSPEYQPMLRPPQKS
jgi:hypothetical protein